MEIERMHRKYGPVVRITPAEIHVRDPVFYHELFVMGAVRKMEAYPRFAEGTGFEGNLIPIIATRLKIEKNLLILNEDMVAVSTTHDMHRVTRALLNPFFSIAGIARVEERAVQRVEQLRSRLNGFVNTGIPVNITHAFNSLMTDIVSCMLFEEPSDYLNDPTFNAEWFEVLKKGAVTIPLLAHMPWFAKLLVMPVVRALSERITKWRIWDDKARRQMVKSRLRPADEAKNRSDTTFFDHLVHSDLVESIFGNGGFSRLSQTPISMTNHWIHMDADIFPDPRKFEPERWLGNQDKVKLMYDYFVPFSKGSRACLAKNLVDMTIYHTIGKLYGPLAPRMILHETNEDAVRPVHGLLFPFPQLDSPGDDKR
ncbi:hypothetical protein N7495_006759 [Penicillium taxi]|uniref:uncharacterized protein n=1 Tax=Penicillium taxi TaxID=168475 RepID=UPI0025458804|nr:uncharacterized protein N7495_006759 [Penicillium taxi]KAJ5895068.1 hypothetical protein N7495_006759 [Penicillium taxi]